MKQQLGVDAELQKGSGGVFTVAVEDEIVARKTLEGFPAPDAIVAAVKAKLPA